MWVRVECYEGRKAYERPLRFWIDDDLKVVEEVLESWYAPSHTFFKVRADDGILYVLRHDISVADGEWILVGFDNSKAV